MYSARRERSTQKKPAWGDSRGLQVFLGSVIEGRIARIHSLGCAPADRSDLERLDVKPHELCGVVFPIIGHLVGPGLELGLAGKRRR